MSHDPEEIGAHDPFSAEAIALTRGRLMTTEAERGAVAAEIAHLDAYGYVFLHHQITGDALAGCRAAIDEINSRTPHGRFPFEGHHTHRAYCVVAQTRSFDELIAHRRILAIIEGYFGEAPQLSASMGMTLYEGQTAQPLHRDTGHFPLPWPRPPLEVNAIWAFDDFTRETGATRLIPGSHRIESETRPVSPVIDAEMTAGSVLIYDGSLWHGGGAATAAGARRRSVNNIYIRQWLRQQDNLYLSVPVDAVLTLPTAMQRLLGYWIYGFTLGVVEGGPPLAALRRRLDRDTDA